MIPNLQRQRRISGRQRVRHERPHRLAQRGGGDGGAGAAHGMKDALNRVQGD